MPAPDRAVVDERGGQPPSDGAGDRGNRGDGSGRRVVVTLDVATLVTIAVGLAAMLLLFAISSAAADTLIRVGIGAVVALALDPLVCALQRRLQVRRLIAVLVVGGLFLALATFVVVVMGPPAINQAEQFSKELPETVEQMYDFPLVGGRLEDAGAADKVKEWAEDLPARLDDRTVGDLARGVLGGVLAAFEVAIVAFALLLDGESLVARTRRLFPPRRRMQADRVGRIFYRVFGRYFAGSLLIAAMAGLVVLAAGLALGVPLAPVAALWMVLVNMIPQIGGFLGGALFVTLATTKDLRTGVICLVLYLIYNTIENHVLQPAIVGESVGLSPPTTMMAALIGGAAAGVPGALVATPIAGTVKVLYLELRHGERRDPGPAGLVARLRARRSGKR